MAQGDVTLFNDFLQDVGRKVHNLETDTIKCALTDGTTTPTAATANPCWGAGGSTNFAAEEVSAGGNYSAGGIDIAATYSQTSGTATFDGATNPSWSQHASNPTDATWAIVYNDTATNKDAICFVDLGGAFDMTTGDLTITWAGGGIATMS